jgi:hypothetical protein
MNKRIVLIAFVALLALTAVVLQAQEIIPRPGDEIDPNANISFPPPVYVVRGEIDIYGTANLPDMQNFFIEFRPVIFPALDAASDEQETEEPWFPVTLPRNNIVLEDVLGSWNTETAPDGLYEIRLTINTQGRPATFFNVSPIRIENNPPPFVEVNIPPTATATNIPSARPTLAATPTPLSTIPQVTANVNANVRSGDSTGYPVVGTLEQGETARIIGVSAYGSGWYYIEMANGQRVWIAPSTVTPSGDLRSIQRINPPASPTPPATPTPVTTGNLAGTSPSLNPASPTCNVSFQVLTNITNTGSVTTGSPAAVTIQDVYVATGQVQATEVRTIPQLSPGQNYVVGATFTISTYYNEQHRIVVIIDSGNQVNEDVESDNITSATYTLQQGGC